MNINIYTMFYVYTYLREDGTPYYVGKGSGERAYKKWGKGIKPPKDVSRIIIVEDNLEEEQAFELERTLIAKYGRKDLANGILHNKTDGGDGSSGHKVNGWKWSEESRAKRRGTGNPQYGKKQSEELKNQKREKMLGFKHDPADVARRAELQKGKFVGEKSPVYGRKKKPEEIEKQLKSRVYKPLSDEQKEKLRQANLGKKQSPESIAKMLATKLAKKLAKTS
jgi:NUMOD3 motif